MDSKLIRALVDKTAALLPFRVNNLPKLGDLDHNTACLISLSKLKFSSVIEELVNLQTSLLNSNPTTGGELTLQKLADSKLIVLNIILKVLADGIGNNKLDLHFDDDLLSEDTETNNNNNNIDSNEGAGAVQQDANGDNNNININNINAESQQAAAGDGTTSGLAADDLSTTTTTNNKESITAAAHAAPAVVENFPEFDDAVAASLLRCICDTMFKPSVFHQQKIQRAAARVLFKLSIIKFDVVFACIEKGIRAENTDLNVFKIMEYVNFKTENLSRLLGVLCEMAPRFKKAAFFAMAKPLRQAVWNWITFYPTEFVSLCQTKTTLPGHPEILFDIIDIWIKNDKNRRALMWPVQVMLLLLCPEILANVAMAIKQGNTKGCNLEDKSKKLALMEALFKAIKGTLRDRATQDISVAVFVDVCKASNYVSKSDMSALRLLVPEVQNHVQDRLMDAESPPIRNSENQVDVKLMVDFLVSSFRLNQRHFTSYIFPLCFKLSAPLYKLVMCKALLRLAQEGKALPWHPTLSVSYAYLAKPLRTLFNELFLEEKKFANESVKADDAMRRNRRAATTTVPSVGTAPEPTETLLTLLTVFRQDPKIVLENTSSNPMQHITEMLQMFSSLCNCLSLRDVSDPQIQQQAFKVLFKMSELRYIEAWSPQDVANGFIEISSSVLTHLASMLVADKKDIRAEEVTPVLKLMKTLIQNGNKFIAQHKSVFTAEHFANKTRISAFEKVESALLVLICNTDTEIWSTAASCFGDVCEQIEIVGDMESPLNSVYVNFSVYNKLSSVQELGKGVATQQKKIRKLFKRIETQTQANLSAFVEVYTRWQSCTDAILKTITDESSDPAKRDRSRSVITNKETEDAEMQKIKNTWRNYTTFLCALGGVCVQKGAMLDQSAPPSPSNASSSNNSLVDQLIQDLMKNVTSDVLYVRKMVTATIGSDLSPSLYGPLFQNFHKKVGSFVGKVGELEVKEQSTLFVDQAISIVQQIIEQPQKETSEGYLALADFESLILSFVRYCSLLVLNPERAKIKVKLCELIIALMNKRQSIIFRSEAKFRNELLQAITEWTSDFALRSDSSIQSGDSAQVTRIVNKGTLFKDLDFACMKAIAALLDGFPLVQVVSGKGSKSTDDTKMREFHKYFSFLKRYLEDRDGHVQLREATIHALRNLLQSNVNYGLESFLKMAYHRDEDTRAAFLSVLTSVIREGIGLTAKEEEAQGTDPYERLINLFEDNDYAAIFQFCDIIPIQEQDDVCVAIIKIFETRNKALDLIKVAIKNEVRSTTQSATLFRANSTASKMMSAYSRLVGGKYLHSTFHNIITELCNNPGAFEIDPSRMPKDQNLEANIKHLTQTAQAFLDCIFLSLEECPTVFREICHALAETVEAQFPSTEVPNSYTVAELAEGGFIFLRFICPAIVSPSTYGIIEKMPDNDTKRFLLLIVKLLTNNANGVQFGGFKEESMIPLNPFILKNIEPTRQFFRKLAQIPEKRVEVDAEISDSDKEECLAVIHRYLFQYIEKFQQEVIKRTTAQGESTASITKMLSMSEKLTSLVTELGKPQEKKKVVKETASASNSENRLLENFLQRMNGKDTSKIEEKGLFYQRGISRMGRPVVYCIIRQLDDEDDFDLVLYHVFKTLMTVWSSPYEILFDATLWERQQFNLDFRNITNLMPVVAKKNLKACYILNPNTHFKQQARNFSRFFDKKKANKIIFITDLQQLYSQFIAEKECHLPDTTVDIEKSTKSTFSPATIITGPFSQKEAIIRLSDSMLFVIYLKDNIFHHETNRVDMIHIISISEIVKVPNPKHDSLDEVVIRYGFDNVLTLRAPTMKDQLIQAVKSANERQTRAYRLAAQQEGKISKPLSPNDIPGYVLNMCFFNLESKSPTTRTAAYNLLASLALKFGFPVTHMLMEADVMCVPTNTADLVVLMSETIAASHPHLTLEFLKEALNGFSIVSTSNKLLCLKYIRPWIKNLAGIHRSVIASKQAAAAAAAAAAGATSATPDTAHGKASDELQQQFEKLQQLFSTLTKSTIQVGGEIFAAVLSEIWVEVSNDTKLVGLALESILHSAVESGVGSNATDLLNELTVTLVSSTENAQYVVRNLIDRILAVLDSEVQSAHEPLENHPPWAKIIIFCRFLLMLSFQNKIDVLHHLPYLFHIITLLAGRGSLYVRSTILSLAINTIHSLCIAIHFTPEQKKIMRNYLSQLQSPRFKLVFLGTNAASIDPFCKPNLKEKAKLEEIRMWDLEMLSLFFVDVMNTCCSADWSLKHWHDTWESLCKNTALNGNTLLLPSVLAVYGIISRPSEAEDLMPFSLECLINSLENYSPRGGEVDLPIAILLSLGQFALKLPPTGALFGRLLLLPFMLLPAADTKLFPAVIHLLECVLKAFEKSPAFKEFNSIEGYFNKRLRSSTETCDDGGAAAFVQRLESVTGVSFKTSFSFALACFLMKGLTTNATKPDTLALLHTLMNISGKLSTNVSDYLGYVTALVPSTSSTTASASSSSSSSSPHDGFHHHHHHLFVEENFPDPQSTLMFTCFLLTIVNCIELENERVIIYEVLQHAFQSLPHVFSQTFGQAMERVVDVFNGAQSAKVAEVSLILIKTMMADNGLPLEKSPQLSSALSAIGFQGIAHFGSFKSMPEALRRDCTNLSIEYIRSLINILRPAPAATTAATTATATATDTNNTTNNNNNNNNQ